MYFGSSEGALVRSGILRQNNLDYLDARLSGPWTFKGFSRSLIAKGLIPEIQLA